MPQVCSICNHPEREAIESALIGGEAYRSVAKQFECSEASMYRHKRNCIKVAIQSVETERIEQAAQIVGEANERRKQFVWNVLAEMEWLHEEVRDVYKAAKGAGDHSASIKALGEVRQQMKLFSELLKGMEPGQAEKLEAEWIAVREAIFNALEPFPEARLAVARALLALGRGDDHESEGQLLQAPAPDSAS